MIGGSPAQAPVNWVRGTKVEAAFATIQGPVIWIKFKGVDGWKTTWMGGMMGAGVSPGGAAIYTLLLNAKTSDRFVDVAFDNSGAVVQVYVW